MGQFENKGLFAPDRLITLASASAIADVAMAQISPVEAESILNKLLNERVPLHAFFKGAFSAEARISGFVDSKAEGRVTVSSSGPPFDAEQGSYLSVLFNDGCKVWYGEKRELPAPLRHVSERYGESALTIESPDSDEWLALFFTI